MTLPNFLVVGAAKCGTTSLAYYLNQSQDVFILERKEGRFFSRMRGDFVGPGAAYQNDIVKDIDSYRQLYRSAGGHRARGDLSNDYLFYHERAIPTIRKYLRDDVRIVILLRNPVDRAYSNYLHHVKRGWERLTFEEALAAEEEREAQNWAWPYYYKKAGLYADSVGEYLRHFPNTSIHLFREFRDSAQLVRKVCDVIGVASTFSFDQSAQNKTGYPKYPFIRDLLYDAKTSGMALKKVARVVLPQASRDRVREWMANFNVKKRPMKKDTRRRLLDYFASDVEKTEQVTGLDLSHWRV